MIFKPYYHESGAVWTGIFPPFFNVLFMTVKSRFALIHPGIQILLSYLRFLLSYLRFFAAGIAFSFNNLIERMEKFLLLRDNKQTGPYSAADLEKMGLKSYDLIWVDGKSAAWRYPGEIDALKSFAPPVEEQPYDRFYKKDQDTDHKESDHKEAIQKESYHKEADQKETGKVGIDHNRIVRKEIDRNEIPVEKKRDSEKNPARHIFVSIPKRKSEPVNKSFDNSEHANYLPPVSPSEKFPDRTRESINESAAYMTANLEPEPTRPSNEFVSKTDEKPLSVNTKGNKGLNPVYLMAAALFLFALISVFLYMNYKEQNKQLNRLNEIVLNMQQGSEVKSTTPVYNAVAPVLQPESLLIDTLGATKMNLTPVERSPEEKSVAKKPVSKKIINTDTSTKESVLQEPTETKPAIINNTPSPGRSVKRRGSSDQLKITTNDFKVGFLGGISGLQVTLANNGETPMEKVDVAVEYLSKENKVVKTQVLTFKNIAPGAALTQDVPRVARGITVRCKIGQAQSSESVASNQEPSGKTP